MPDYRCAVHGVVASRVTDDDEPQECPVCGGQIWKMSVVRSTVKATTVGHRPKTISHEELRDDGFRIA